MKKEPTDAGSLGLGRASASRRNMLLQDVAASSLALSTTKSIVNKLTTHADNLSGSNYIPVGTYFEDAFKLRLQLDLPFNGPKDLAVRNLFDHALLVSAVETALLKVGRQ